MNGVFSRGAVPLQAAVIIAATACVYVPALRGGAIWDDHLTFETLRLGAGWPGLGRFWSGAASFDYLPLKQTVQWVLWTFFGAEPLAYHLVNVGLHATGALLLWRVLGRLGVAQAWLGGLLFAIHPVAVESVAWISEVKNALSFPFLLLSLDAWLDWRESGRTPSPVLSLLWFVLSLLSKTSGVMLPVFLLACAWWRDRRLSRSVAAVAPFFAVCLVLGVIQIGRQKHLLAEGTALPLEGIGSRLAAAGIAPWFYFSKCVLPAKLLLLYPRWHLKPPPPAAFLPWLATAAILAWMAAARKGWGGPALLGAGWFLLNLLPMAGIVPMSYLVHSWVADHFAYISLAGLAGMAAAGAGRWAGTGRNADGDQAPRGRRAPPWPTLVATIGAAVALAIIARSHAAEFRSEVAVWRPVAAADTDLAVAQENYGEALLEAERFAEAVDQFEVADRIRPNLSGTMSNLGLALYRTGHLKAAIATDRRALRLGPNDAAAMLNLATALEANGQEDEALRYFRDAVRAGPGNGEAHHQLGSALLRLGRLAEAEAEEKEAVRLRPDSPEAHNDLGTAFGKEGRAAEAIAQYREALRLRPGYAEARNNLQVVLRAAGDAPAAP